MSQTRERRVASTRESPSRRQFLAVAGTAVAAGFAGCSGGSDENGQPGSTENSGDSATPASGGSVTCTDVAAEYASYTAGEVRLLFDFEYPAILGEDLNYLPSDGSVQVNGSRSLDSGDNVQVDLVVNQLGTRMDDPSDLTRPDRETVTEISFAGETRPVETRPGVSRGSQQLFVMLPNDAGGDVGYYQTLVQLEHNGVDPATLSDACVDAIETAAIHVVESLEPNPDTTMGESA